MSNFQNSRTIKYIKNLKVFFLGGGKKCFLKYEKWKITCINSKKNNNNNNHAPLTRDLRKANSKRAQKSELNGGREARNSPYQANPLHRQTGYFFFLFLWYKNPIFFFFFLFLVFFSKSSNENLHYKSCCFFQFSLI